MNDQPIDKRNMLQNEVFGYRITKANRVLLYYHDRHIKTLKGNAADKFQKRIADASDFEAQLLMAKATGNFKRGNEKL